MYAFACLPSAGVRLTLCSLIIFSLPSWGTSLVSRSSSILHSSTEAKNLFFSTSIFRWSRWYGASPWRSYIPQVRCGKIWHHSWWGTFPMKATKPKYSFRTRRFNHCCLHPASCFVLFPGLRSQWILPACCGVRRSHSDPSIWYLQ